MLSLSLQSAGLAPFFYLAYGFAILVSSYCALLFWIVYRREYQLRTAWRAIGFFTLVIANSLFILAPFKPSLEVIGAITTTIGFLLIYKGVRTELTLSHLRRIAPYTPVAAGLAFSASTGIATIAHVATVAVTLATIRLQIRRLTTEENGHKTFMQNLYPLIGYTSLCASYALLIMYSLMSEAAWLPYAILLLTLVGFLFLSLWSWVFIKIRPKLRISWLILANGTAVLSILALLTTSLFIFGFRTLFSQIATRLVF